MILFPSKSPAREGGEPSPRPLLGLLAALALALLPWQAAIAGEGKFEPLTIVTATGAHHFSVEVMQTQPELEKGLMFRKSMPADQGMLFNFHTEGSVMMWMKNTFIPLDMIFMGKTGKVVGIVADARPMSEQILTAAVPTYAVLELNGGVAAKIGLKVGDKVEHPIFSP
ncbi:MAG TPA: DUF192 domain-containing protein [Methylovirgula sp.]|nr:DUF192 domain-containing protein [Methylovirgula sp.]